MSTKEDSLARRPDRTLWLIAAVLAVALGVIIWIANRKQPELAARTAKTGMPLTREQQSVDFQTADLTFAGKPNKHRIDGRAVLGFLVKAPITKLQFDLDPELPIQSIAADGQQLQGSAWKNDGGLVTVNLPAPKNPGDKLSLTVVYGGKPHVAKRAPWDGGIVWSHTKDGKPWVATAVEGEGCDLFWPCFDNSMVEVGSVTQHVIVPKGLSAPSNGRLLGVDTLSDGRTRWNWQARHPKNYANATDAAPYKSAQA